MRNLRWTHPGFGSASERRAADLFYADLVGMPAPSRDRTPRDTARVEATEDDITTAATVELTIVLTGRFGGDFSSTVKIKRGKKTVLATATITAPDSEVTMRVDKHAAYVIEVTPTVAAPDDRYRKTEKPYEPKGATSASVTVRLNVNRENQKNVDDTWRENNIDVVKAAKVSSKPLCGRFANVNAEADALREAANKAYLALSSTLQQEIKDSLQIVGGYNRRTQTSGEFSNHSIGTAIDVNYNMDLKQNHHFKVSKTKRKGKKTIYYDPVLELVQTVVRTESTFASFDIYAGSRDLVQWDAAAAFNRLFPPFLETLVAEATGATPNVLAAFPATGGNVVAFGRPLAVTRKDVKKAHDTTTDATRKKQLGIVLDNWDVFWAWLYGAPVVDDNGKVRAFLIGMIPMHRKFVELMVNAGWTWGGQWTGSKDYMHFEDTAALDRLHK